MTLEAIKEAIQQLPEPDRRKLGDWFDELEEHAWDEQMQRDFSSGGRGHHLVEKINREIDEGKFTPLKDGLRTGLKQP